jgi:hypothetical protein
MGMPQIDPTTAATAAATIIWGPELAALAGPYAVIIFGAAVGAAWALGRSVPTSRLCAGLTVLRLIATAVLLAVAVEQGLVHVGALAPDAHWALGLIALLIGGIGDDWPSIARWALGLAGRAIARRVGDDAGDRT